MTESSDPPPAQRSLGDRLGGARRRRVVGRGGELEMFRAALAGLEATFRVLFVHGPGGVGKSTLLATMADAATADGAGVLRVDARLFVASPEAVDRAVASAAGLPDLGAVEAVARIPRPVLLVDTAESLTPVEEWLRAEFLPRLPGDALVVIAGRTPPSARWVADPAWRDVLRVVSLRNLPPQDARAYLRAESVPAALHDRLLLLSHGHPLTLTMLVDTIGPDADRVPESLTDVPGLVGTLLTQIVDTAPSGRHRAALEIAAHAHITTEELLRAVLGGQDAAELFAWVRGLSFVEVGRHGLYPHDVARDALDADLRWRDPQRYAELHRAIRGHLLDQIAVAGRAADRQRQVADAIFVSRHHPALSRYLEGLDDIGRYIDEFRPADRAALVEMTARHQGSEQSRLLEHWLDRQPASFRVFRGPDGTPAGFAGYLNLHEAGADDLEADPGARAMWRYAHEHGPPRPGEEVTAWRFFLDREQYHEPSASLTLVAVWNVQEILARPHRSWDFLGTYTDVATWLPIMTYMDFGRAESADYEVGGVTYAVFAHDWRRVGVADWLERTAAHELDEPAAPLQDHGADLVLSQAEFADAVRAALRDLHDTAALRANPLLRSRLVRDRGGGPDALRTLFGAAAAQLANDPRASDLHAVLDRTFLRPAPTQERAAEMLHLSFSTYRRHRDRAVARVVDALWHEEVYGPPADEHRMTSERPGD